jgi:hypothetical protein
MKLYDSKCLLASPALVAALFLTDLVQAGTQQNAEPRSGIIVRGDQKVWFDGSFTRTESYGSLSSELLTYPLLKCPLSSLGRLLDRVDQAQR